MGFLLPDCAGGGRQRVLLKPKLRLARGGGARQSILNPSSYGAVATVVDNPNRATEQE